MSTQDETKDAVDDVSVRDEDDPEDVLAAPPSTSRDGDAVVARAPRRRVSPVTAMLVGLAVIAVSFLGGMLVQRQFGTTPASALTFPGPAASGGPGGGQANGNGFAVGTVTRVSGSTVYIKTADGRIITVTTDANTTVRISSPGKVSDLKPGSNVVVQGSQNGSTIAASNVSEGDGLPGGGRFGNGGPPGGQTP
jgi:hypothetical protein